ncbi:hypothetical protein BD779DRAFT_1476647 [Infundibulicybe gibba]|nr:hypothetical protein BD779DRAFT_1476647 [Infundibulicybe gibba]
MQARTYFHRFFHRDHYILKFVVAYIWVPPAIRAGCHLPRVSIATAVGLTVVYAVQGIYVFRMYRFNRNRYLLVFCCVLGGMVLGTGFTWVGADGTHCPCVAIGRVERRVEVDTYNMLCSQHIPGYVYFLINVLPAVAQPDDGA